jgi:hypothetical protein
MFHNFPDGLLPDGTALIEKATEFISNDSAAEHKGLLVENDMDRTESKLLYQRQRQQGKLLRRKERNVEQWNTLTEEEKDEQKQQRKRRLEDTDDRLRRALTEGIKLCIDLGFDVNGYHSEKEQRSLSKQVSLSYAAVKRADNPVHLHITSFNDSSVTGQGLVKQVQRYSGTAHIYTLRYL